MSIKQAPNPNPDLITDAIWNIWLGAATLIPGVRLSGIYADKVCYHNTVKRNKEKWPGAYCIQLPLDLKGPLDKARAIDLSMSEAEMKKRTGYLNNATKDPKDDRLKGVREFFGTLDGVSVKGRAKDDEDGPWYNSTSDSSHLWHIHISFFTYYCNNWTVLAPVLSVLAGETYQQWKDKTSMFTMALVKDKATNKHWLSMGMLFRREVPEAQVSGVKSWIGPGHMNCGDPEVVIVSDINAFGVDVSTFIDAGGSPGSLGSFSFSGTAVATESPEA